MARAVVRIELSDCAERFLVAVADLLAAVRDADQALLEDSVASAAERVIDALRSDA